MAPYGGESLDEQAISCLADEGLDACFGGSASSLESSASDLPIDVGTDARNGLTLEVFYSCSDVCPDAGWVGIRYKDVIEESCCSSGGIPGYDFAFGSYIGCAPPEATFGDIKPCALN